jgi:hypothetical protein
MFTENFKAKARDGDSISCVVNGITYRATIEREDDAGAPDKNSEGFWPSLDKDAPGWVGENPLRTYDEQMANCREVMTRWKTGKMVYCGVILSAEKAGIQLLERYHFALWGVDVNWPWGDNAYLREVANDLLHEAQETAEAKLAAVITQAEETLRTLIGV